MGSRVSLASLRGHPVIVTFIDPLCRNFCPREASVLTQAASQLGPNAPTIVSVSVDPWGDSAANFRLDAVHWRLGPGWRWGTGTYAELARGLEELLRRCRSGEEDDRRGDRPPTSFIRAPRT